MRILFCNYEYPPLGGGGGVINAALAEELARGHEVTVLTSQRIGLERTEMVRGVRVLRVPVLFRRHRAVANIASMATYVPMGLRAGRGLLRRETFDIINTHFVLPTGPVGDALSRRSGIPNVLSLHGGDLYDPSKRMSPHRHVLLRALVRKLLRRADTVIGQSSNTVDNVHRYFLPDLPAKRIPLGIPRPAFVPSTREALGFADDQILLVTVGRLVARKAVDQLIKVLAETRNPKVHLVVVGSGTQLSYLQELSRALEVGASVHFVGNVSDSQKLQLLHVADVFVSTSQHEGFGLVFLEGMSCGLPVVCYDHGGQTDFLQSQVTGFVVKLNDRQQFAESCRHLVENPELRTELGRKNQVLVEEYFIDRCAAQYESLFESVLRQRQRPRRRA